MGEFFQTIVDGVWLMVMTLLVSVFGISVLFNRIIHKEIERGGEEYGERAVTKIQKWSTAFWITSFIFIVGIIAYQILGLFGIELG